MWQFLKVEEELTKKNDAGAKKVVEEEDLEGGLPDSSTRMISIRKPIVEVRLLLLLCYAAFIEMSGRGVYS